MHPVRREHGKSRSGASDLPRGASKHEPADSRFAHRKTTEYAGLGGRIQRGVPKVRARPQHQCPLHHEELGVSERPGTGGSLLGSFRDRYPVEHEDGTDGRVACLFRLSGKFVAPIHPTGVRRIGGHIGG